MPKQFRGTGVALVTPFNSDGSIDFEGLHNLINHVIEGGVEYVVTMGTTGEAVTLSPREKKQVIKYTVDKVAQRVPVVAGFGGNNTAALVSEIEAQDFTGIDGILSASPSYNKPTQEGIYQHYKAIAEVAPVPVILYNVPGRTASNITSETTLRLAHDFDKIVAIKEASGDLEQAMRIVKDKPDDFVLLSGEDPLTLPMLSFGGEGVISVIANAFPRQYSDMVRYGLENDTRSATPLHLQLLPMIKMLFLEGNPGGVKCALSLLGVCGDTLRLPLVNVSNELKAAMKLEIESIQQQA